MPAASPPSETRFVVDPARRELRLEHPTLDAAWTWDDAGHVAATRLTDRRSGASWIDPAFPSRLYDRPTARAQGEPRPTPAGPPHAEISPPEPARDGDVARASWRLSPAGAPLAVTWHLEAHPDHAVLRQWSEIANTGAAPVTIDTLPVLRWTFGGGPRPLVAHHGLTRRHAPGRSEWFDWTDRPLAAGTSVRVRSGHRQDATFLAVTSAGDGPGLFIGWESNAEAFCDAGDVEGDGSMAVSCGLEPAYRLAPGETLRGPAGFTGLATGDLDELSYRCQRFVDDRLAWKADDPRFPFVTFNSWGYETDIDAPAMERCFAICAKLGVELFVVDFGWEDPDWRPLADRFPDGLKPLSDAAHAAGMLFGIHLAFGNISSLSRACREHPEWGHGPGMWAYRREGEVYGLSLANPAARDWVVETLCRVVDENGIDYFLTDTELWGHANPAAQPLHATDDYMTVAEGFDDVLARFRAARPDVVLEHCDNGLGLPTYKMVQQHATSIGADAWGTLSERTNKYRISRVLPPRFLDSYVCDRPRPGTYVGEGLTDYDYRSHMFGGPMILMTAIKTLEEGSEDWRALERAIGLAKRVRRRVLGGKVLHLLEPQPLEQVGHGWDGWDAIGSYDETADSAVVFAFRLGGETDRRAVPIRGLRPETRYRVTFEDRPEVLTATGRDLMANGVPLTLPLPGRPSVIDANGMVRGSEVIFVEPAAEG
ncbi:MAG: alpha-galactosidase [Chloroflexota bacterium]|nr:alpha-galactosidase [Chloroflexota bacterium]